MIAVSATTNAENVISSPNKKITVEIKNDIEANHSGLRICYENKVIQTYVKIGIATGKNVFFDNLDIIPAGKPELIKDEYEMITGKRRLCSNYATEQTFKIKNSNNQDMDITLRVYNDGIAFRYGINESSNDSSIEKEYTTYCITEGQTRWMQTYAPDSYERFYTKSKTGYNADSHKWGYPALVETTDSVFILISESDITKGNCASYLDNENKPEEFSVTYPDNRLDYNKRWFSPWRVMIIGKLADIVESTLITDVASPSTIAETQWITPGVASWIYWAYNHGTKDYQLLKKYVDLANDMQWEYTLIDWEWDTMGNGGNIEDIVRYASSKGIEPLMWYNSSTNWIGESAPTPLYRLNTKENREKEFTWLNSIGVKGVKIDFFPGDMAPIMDLCINILEDAAKHHLMVNFHGATIPRGWQRTYPNLMSIEGVYGAEWYNNGTTMTDMAATHNATLPFTRNVVGPMDYTPGTFSNSQFPHITTYAHELALTALFESGIQHMPDKPETYYTLPKEVKNILMHLPAAWDDTKLLSGYPGTEVVLARRIGNKWYIAGINGTKEKRVLSFDTERMKLNYKTSCTIVKDGKDDKSFDISQKSIETNEVINIPCLPMGGFLIVTE
ncbi:glycoside hydrolase family 97 catalytic domain-containing protein [Bacteroides caecigallinarum]|nr:glycoside hydrolase family 97 catalytic domain-containing protein [Bacteroides caecigallinarum]